jgi:hypothetical protein
MGTINREEEEACSRVRLDSMTPSDSEQETAERRRPVTAQHKSIRTMTAEEEIAGLAGFEDPSDSKERRRALRHEIDVTDGVRRKIWCPFLSVIRISFSVTYHNAALRDVPEASIFQSP